MREEKESDGELQLLQLRIGEKRRTAIGQLDVLRLLGENLKASIGSRFRMFRI